MAEDLSGEQGAELLCQHAQDAAEQADERERPQARHPASLGALAVPPAPFQSNH